MRYMYVRFRKVDKEILTKVSNDWAISGKFGKWRQISSRPLYEEPLFIKGNIQYLMPIAAHI